MYWKICIFGTLKKKKITGAKKKKGPISALLKALAQAF